jgi:plasmid stabilization system protein ParE
MRKIIVSKRASKKLESLLEYLEDEWSVDVKLRFIEKLDRALKQIDLFPQSNPLSEIKKGLFRVVITRHITLFYQFDSKTIKVITLFANRMDPKKLLEDLK